MAPEISRIGSANGRTGFVKGLQRQSRNDGKTFEQMKIYQDIKKRIETVVNLPAFTDELFPQDIASMLKSRLTFKEAIASPDQTLMSRHRLKVAQREFYSRLDSLAV